MTQSPSDNGSALPVIACDADKARLSLALDALVDNAAVLDAQGVIVMINLAWRQYALAYSPLPGQMPTHSDVGSNYLAVAEHSYGALDYASRAVNGIRAVLSGKVDSFTLRYPCHTPRQQFWYTMKVTPLIWDGQRGALVTHTDTTPHHRLQSK